MQTPTTNIVDQAIAKQEAEEAGVVDDPKNPQGGDDANKDPKDPADDKGGESKSGKDDGKAGGEESAKPKYDKDGKRIEPADEEKPELDADGNPVVKSKEGEFTADDAVETPEPPKTNTPEAPTDNAGIRLSAAEQKHIADNIGEPIVIQGFIGEGENQKPIEIKAYSPQDIPANFKFANDQQLAATTTGFQKLEQKANELLGGFRQNQSQQAARDFEERENNGIKDDVADLQKEGRFPKFTVRPGEKGFDETPEAKQMADVLAIMAERNETFLKQYNQGRPYKHIGFAEAYDIWERKNPASQASRKADDDQAAEDAERKKTAEHGPTNKGMNPSNIVKPTVRPGTTTRDILARIDNDDSF